MFKVDLLGDFSIFLSLIAPSLDIFVIWVIKDFTSKFLLIPRERYINDNARPNLMIEIDFLSKKKIIKNNNIEVKIGSTIEIMFQAILESEKGHRSEVP